MAATSPDPEFLSELLISSVRSFVPPSASSSRLPWMPERLQGGMSTTILRIPGGGLHATGWEISFPFWLLRRPLIWRCLMLTATLMFVGGEVACGHLLWLGRSTVLRHVLLACYSLCRSKKFLRREGRWLRAAHVQWMLIEGLLQSLATNKTGNLQDPCMNYNVISFIQGALVSFYVNLDLFM